MTEASQDSTPSLLIVSTPVLVREQAFDRLRDAIINGQFPPGTRLIERELCEAMGVSRTSIREVLRRLEAEKLVRVEPRKGPIVARLTRSQAEEVYTIRGFLEGVLVRRFVQLASDAEVKTLQKLTAEFQKAAKHENLASAVASMGDFYAHLAKVANSEVVADVLSQLTARVSVLRSTTMSQPGRMARSVEEICAITEAIAARDADRAEKVAVEHVRSAASAALGKLAD